MKLNPRAITAQFHEKQNYLTFFDLDITGKRVQIGQVSKAEKSPG
jgi:hypothetical protein